MSCGMGFVENHLMQAKSTNVVSSSCRAQSEELLLQMEKPKYKRRKVFGVRTFPPGCGPNAQPNPVIESNGGDDGDSVGLENGSDKSLDLKLDVQGVSNGVTSASVALENGSDRSLDLKLDVEGVSMGVTPDSVALENGGNVIEQIDYVRSKVDSEMDGGEVFKDIIMENGGNMVLPDHANGVAPVAEKNVDISPYEKLESGKDNAPTEVLQHETAGLLKGSSNDAELTDPVKVTVAPNYPPRRKILGVREFPPNCGRNAKPPSNIEGEKEAEKGIDIHTDAGAEGGGSGSDFPERNVGSVAPKPKEPSAGNGTRNPDKVSKGKLLKKSSSIKRKVAKKSVISQERMKPASLTTDDNQIDQNRDRSQFVKRPTGKISTVPGTSRGSNTQRSTVPDTSRGSDTQRSTVPESSRGSDAQRSKVQEVLRLFHSFCKRFDEEAKSNGRGGSSAQKRVDFLAAKELKDRGMNLNVGQHFIGPVPGVEIGDEFQYRLELNVIGLHRPTQGGIDYTKQPKGIIATSIVASGGYDDNLDNSDVLEYTGQGGVSTKDKQAEDQKLERGNLSLVNSASVKNPVRVVRGRNRVLADGRNGKVYVYDGLYTVDEYWQETGPQGKLVFKFRLVRVPGQTELGWKQSKNSKRDPTARGFIHD